MISRIQAALKLSKAHAVTAGTAPGATPPPRNQTAAQLLHRGHPLRPVLAEPGRPGWVTRLDPPRITRRQARELMAGLLGREPDPGLGGR